MELSDAVLNLQDQMAALERFNKSQGKELATLKQELASMKASKLAGGPSVDVAALTRQIKAEIDREVSPLRAEISQLRQGLIPITPVETKPTGRSLPVPLYVVVVGLVFCLSLIIWGVSSTNSAKVAPAATPVAQPAPVSRPAAKTSKPKQTVQKRRSFKKETDDQRIERINREIDAMSKELGIENEPN